jgi:hypothetical protein
MTAVIGGVSTMQAGLSTPAAAMATMAAGYNWQSGTGQGQQIAVRMAPALGWISLINPNHPAYQVVCGPLYAIAPVLLPLAPIIITSLVITFGRLFLWIIGWLLKLADLIAQVLQVIRG